MDFNLEKEAAGNFGKLLCAAEKKLVYTPQGQIAGGVKDGKITASMDFPVSEDCEESFEWICGMASDPDWKFIPEGAKAAVSMLRACVICGQAEEMELDGADVPGLENITLETAFRDFRHDCDLIGIANERLDYPLDATSHEYGIFRIAAEGHAEGGFFACSLVLDISAMNLKAPEMCQKVKMAEVLAPAPRNDEEMAKIVNRLCRAAFPKLDEPCPINPDMPNPAPKA